VRAMTTPTSPFGLKPISSPISSGFCTKPIIFA
jgi:hypothetical protein